MGHNSEIDTSQLSFIKVDVTAYPLIKRFYKNARYSPKVARNDDIYALLHKQNIIAATRITNLDTHLLLRSMVVHPEHRSNGLGHLFLNKLVAELGALECWCFPFEHLTHFYNAAGFNLVDPSLQPNVIRQAHERYTRQGRVITIMKIN